MSVLILKEDGKNLTKSLDKILSKFDFVHKKRVFIKPNFSGRPPTAVNECGKIVKKNPFKNLNLIRRIYLGNKKINILIGKANENDFKLPKDEKVICISQCAKDFADKCNLDCLNKCPPSVEETLEWIKSKT